jgi:hypothetical protein
MLFVFYLWLLITRGEKDIKIFSHAFKKKNTPCLSGWPY